VDNAFALLHELLDEMAQAKFFDVDCGHGGVCPVQRMGDLNGPA